MMETLSIFKILDTAGNMSLIVVAFAAWQIKGIFGRVERLEKKMSRVELLALGLDPEKVEKFLGETNALQ